MIPKELLRAMLTPEVLDKITISCMVKAGNGEVRISKEDILEVFKNPKKYARVEGVQDGEDFVFRFVEIKDEPEPKISGEMVRRMFGGM